MSINLSQREERIQLVVMRGSVSLLCINVFLL